MTQIAPLAIDCSICMLLIDRHSYIIKASVSLFYVLVVHFTTFTTASTVQQKVARSNGTQWSELFEVWQGVPLAVRGPLLLQLCLLAAEIAHFYAWVAYSGSLQRFGYLRCIV